MYGLATWVLQGTRRWQGAAALSIRVDTLVVEEGIESQRSLALITPRTRKPQGKILVRRAEREANYMP